MASPQHPIVTASLLESFAKLKHRVTTRDAAGTTELGVLVERPAHKMLMVVNGEWIVGIAPPGTPVFLFTRDTYDVLRQGSATEGGGFVSGGKTFRLKANDSTTPHTADIVPA